jgi:hypothetical protein
VRTPRGCSCLSALPIFGYDHVVGREYTKGHRHSQRAIVPVIFAGHAMHNITIEVQERLSQLLDPETLKYS